MIAAALLGLSACSDDGLVTAQGRLLVEGEPASSGRISLTPTGDSHADKGKRKAAVALIAPDGAFVLRTGGESVGAAPGAYRALFVHEFDPPNKDRGAGNQVAADELKV
ncbi:MAG: hypothetical protein AAF961_15575, partial [Planctomycetota bacterium]